MFPTIETSSLRQILDFGRNPQEFLRSAEALYGDHFISRFLGDRPRLWISNPESIAKVMALPRSAYVQANDVPLNIGENSVLYVDGTPHRDERRRLSAPLHGERMREYGSLMLSAAQASFGRLKVGAHVKMRSVFQEMALDVILRCVFGVASAAELDRLRAGLNAWLDVSLTPAWFIAGTIFQTARVRRFLDRRVERFRHRRPRWGLAPWSRAVQAKVEVDARVLEEIARCRANPEGRVDILARLIFAEGDEANDEYLLTTLLTLLVGGYETVANSLCWVLHDLLPHPDVARRIRAEIDDVFGGQGIEPRRIGELVYLDAVIKESGRMNPASIGIARVPLVPMELGGQQVPAGLALNLTGYLTQRRPDIWDEPSEFRPERFIGRRPARNEYFPFGGGARICVGQAFAEYEMRVALAELIANHELRLDPHSDETPQLSGISVAPKGGLRVFVEPFPQSDAKGV